MTRRKTQLKTYGTKKYTKTKREKKKNIVPNQEKKNETLQSDKLFDRSRTKSSPLLLLLLVFVC